MSKEKTLRTSEETEVMQATGVPAQETEGAGVVMATEIIADLKEQLQEAKEETKAVTEDWMLVLGQREILRKKMKNRRAKSDEKMYINTGPLQRSNHGSGSEQQRQKIIAAHL